MKKEPQLYVKNDKGRYEPYQVPEPPYNNCLYRKEMRGNKAHYTPVSMLMANNLNEGVWVVTKTKYGKSYSNGKYLYDSFLCLKASDIQEVSLAKLGGLTQLADYLSDNWGRIPQTTPLHDKCMAIVGLLFQYEKEKQKSKELAHSAF